MSNDVRICIAYDGAAYHGWQVQPDVRTVQGELYSAASRMLVLDREDFEFHGASRTDAGVHALGQVATIHYPDEIERRPWDFVRALNALTDDDICVLRVEPSPPGFHPRHDSGGKTYRYRIWNHRFAHPLELGRAWHVRQALDLELMRRSAAQLVGEHDFSAFRSSRCQAETTVRRMRRVEIFASGPDASELVIEIEGDAFLQYMVRIMAGTLVDIGRGQLPEDIVPTLLSEGARRAAGPTAPPHGLTLVAVHYPDHRWEGGEPDLGGPYM